MKSNKFSSIEELKAEVEAKADTMLPVVVAKAMVTYQAKESAVVERIDKFHRCKKHGAMHAHCAALGIQRTKFNRWQRNGDRMFSSHSLVTESDMCRMEEAYDAARKAFHLEPCTCHPSN